MMCINTVCRLNNVISTGVTQISNKFPKDWGLVSLGFVVGLRFFVVLFVFTENTHIFAQKLLLASFLSIQSDEHIGITITTEELE